VRRIRTPFIILAVIGLLLGFFQNCTPAVPFGNVDYYQQATSSPIFPYEVGVDQVAYMSCSEQEDIFNDGTFFTFRVGAYDSKGIRLTDEFRQSLRQIYPEDVPAVLSQSLSSARSNLQLAIRTMDNLQLMYVDQDNGEDGSNGFDFNNFFPNMGDEALNQILWSMEPGDYLRVFPSAQFSEQYRFTGELKFMKSQIMENDLRTFFGSRGILAVTFAEALEITPLGPGSFTNLQEEAGLNFSNNTNNLAANVYGAAIQPRFKQPSLRGGNSGPDLPPRVLASVTDVPIDERVNINFERPWVCPENMQFMIVLPEHATDESGRVRCRMEPDPINPNEDYRILRQSILGEDFYIDMVNRCVVPKPDHTVEGSCYGRNENTNLTFDINYDTYQVSCGFGDDSGLCPHFVSVCHRQR
jgi:hypothetical protein